MGKVYISETVRLKTGCGNLYLTICFNSTNKPIHITSHFGKAGGCACAHSSALCDVISKALKIEQDHTIILSGLVGQKCYMVNNCCIDIMARYILDLLVKGKSGL